MLCTLGKYIFFASLSQHFPVIVNLSGHINDLRMLETHVQGTQLQLDVEVRETMTLTEEWIDCKSQLAIHVRVYDWFKQCHPRIGVFATHRH